MADYDVAIVGAGPGGYVTAIRSAQLGLKTALIERAEVGGVCLNWGCIPTKSLLYNAEVVSLLHRAEEFGISFDNLQVDFGKAIDRSRQVVLRLTRGIQGLLRKHGVDYVVGEAYLQDPTCLGIKGSERTLTSHNIILATGARQRTLPMLPVDGDRVIDSRWALEMRHRPSSVTIIGGGATGCEFAYLYNAFGSQVTIIELLPHLLPNEEVEISQQLERSFSQQGIQVLVGTQVQAATIAEQKVTLEVSTGTQESHELICERVLVAVGIQANTEGLRLEETGVSLENGFVKIDARMATNTSGVYAIGDLTGKLPLAHVASTQGILVAEAIAGRETSPINYLNMPRATYCHPQVASFGLTESQAGERGYVVKVGMFPFSANGKAMAMGEPGGMVKVVVDADHGALLGAHLIGAQVTELLAELSVAQILEGTASELGALTHSHPTLSEAIKEAALSVLGDAIHA